MPLFLMYWRRTLRRPGAVYLWLMLPFLFMAIYQAAFGGNSIPRTGLAVLDADSSLVSNLLVASFRRSPLDEMVTVHPVASLEEIEALFAAEDAASGLIIPKGFGSDILGGKDVTLTLLQNPRLYIQPRIAEGVVSVLTVLGNGAIGVFAGPLEMVSGFINGDRAPTTDEVAEISKRFYEIGSDATTLSAFTHVEVVTREEESEDEGIAGFNMASLFFPGLIMFGLLTMSLNLESRMLRDRLDHVTQRLVTAPIRPASIVLQQRLYSASFLYVAAVVSALLGGIIWRIPPVGIVQAHLISIALILFIVGINGSIFGLSSSRKATSAISSVVMMVLLILGGGFFPAEFTPEGFQAISRLTPTGLANMGLTRAITGRDIGVSIPLLLAYCGAFFVVSIVVGRRRIV